jgi:hypothetical protein
MRRYTVVLVLLAVATLSLQCAATDSPADPAAAPAAERAEFDAARARLLARIKDRWSDQIKGSTAIRDEQPVQLAGADGVPAVHGGYAATSPRNPLIDERCRAESLADAVTHWGQVHGVSDDAAFADREAHLRDLQGQFAQGGSFSAWISHVANCKDFCLIAVRDLLACHVQAVAALPHALVFFGRDSDRIDLGSGAAVLDGFARRLGEAPGKRVLLIGRASRVGPAGPAYNRQLSQRRTQAVAAALGARGVPADRIQLQSIGYEEPQITQEIADLYGIGAEFQRLGEAAINQSVVMVLY